MMSKVSIDFKEKVDEFIARERTLLTSDLEQKTESFISLGFSNVVNVSLKPARCSNAFFVEDLLKKINVKPVVVLGGPGAGKSTLLLKFALSLCDSDFIPIYIKFGLQSNYTNLYDEINLPHFSNEEKIKLFETGQLCIIFDGINESSVDINKLLEDIYHLSRVYPDCKFICSCRELEFPSDKKQYYDIFEVLPVSDKQIEEQFIEYLGNIGKKFFSQLKSVRMQYLMDMCRIPLLLSMVISLLFKNRSSIQNKDLYDIDFLMSKSSIYQNFFMYLKNHQSNRQYNSDYVDLEDELLYWIGYGMQKEQKVFISEFELKEIIKNIICLEVINQDLLVTLKQSSKMWYKPVTEFAKKLPFFIASQTNECLVLSSIQKISFLHQSFQEFFAGYFISRNCNNEDFVSEIRKLIVNRSRKNWEALEFASSLCNDSEIINIILDEAKIHKEQTLLILAAKCLLAKSFSKIRQNVVDDCCICMITAFKFWGIPYDYDLIYYTQKLFPYVSTSFPERLKRDIKWFSDKYGKDIFRIEYPISFTIDMLINIANGSNYDAKLDAIYTMGKRNIKSFDFSRAGEYLTNLLESGINDTCVKEEVIKALKELEYSPAATVMLKIIKDKTELKSFRAYALNAIANMKCIDAIYDIMDYMSDHNNPYRDSASWSLQKLALEAKAKGFSRKFDEVKSFYLSCLLNETDDLEGVFAKGNMVYSLSKLDATEYLDQIINWLITQNDAYVIEDGLNAVIVLGCDKVQDVVKRYTIHPDVVVKQMALEYFNDISVHNKITTKSDKKNGLEPINSTKLNKSSTLFISYTECDAPIADIIEKEIHKKLKDEIKISRYTELNYKDSFKQFMDTIQDHDFVLTIVSDTYLRRQACMYEVGEILKDHHYKDRLLFVVLSENERKYYKNNAPNKIEANIYGNAKLRLEYTKFWKDEYDSLNNYMRSIDDFEAIKEAAQELTIIGQIWRKDIGIFLKFLADENGKSFRELIENGFKDIVDWIKAK